MPRRYTPETNNTQDQSPRLMNGLEVLLVEDNTAMRASISRSLSSAGYTVVAPESTLAYKTAIDQGIIPSKIRGIFDQAYDSKFTAGTQGIIQNGFQAAKYLRDDGQLEIGIMLSTFGDIILENVPQWMLNDEETRWYVLRKAKTLDELGPEATRELEIIERDTDGTDAINQKAYTLGVERRNWEAQHRNQTSTASEYEDRVLSQAAKAARKNRG